MRLRNLWLAAFLVAPALSASAATIATFDIDVKIAGVGGDDGMGGVLGDFGLTEGQTFTNAGVLTVVSAESLPGSSAPFIEVTAFDLDLGSAALRWDVADVTGPSDFGFVTDGVVQDVYLPNATNDAGVDIGRRKATRRKASAPPTFYDAVDIFDGENYASLEVTLRQRVEATVPEPGAAGLFAAGVLLVAGRLRRRR